MDKISVAFPETLQRMGRCSYLLCFTHSMCAELFELRRMGWGKSEWIPRREPPVVLEGRSHLFLKMRGETTAGFAVACCASNWRETMRMWARYFEWRRHLTGHLR